MEAPQQRRGRTKQRYEVLLGLVRNGTTHVADLAAALGVSESTVRRDLAQLTADGHVTRTYGGAVVPETFRERPIEESAAIRPRAKAAIAATARQLVPRDSTIFIDAGTTCGALAELLTVNDGGAVPARTVTRGLETAAALATTPDIDVIMLGGQVRHLSHGLVGPLTDIALERFSFSVAFLGADAFDPARGLGEPSIEETRIKEQVAAVTDHVVVLADSSKLTVTAPAWTNGAAGWTLVTDDAGTSTDLADRCAKAGVALVVAGS